MGETNEIAKERIEIEYKGIVYAVEEYELKNKLNTEETVKLYIIQVPDDVTSIEIPSSFHNDKDTLYVAAIGNEGRKENITTIKTGMQIVDYDLKAEDFPNLSTITMSRKDEGFYDVIFVNHMFSTLESLHRHIPTFVKNIVIENDDSFVNNCESYIEWGLENKTIYSYDKPFMKVQGNYLLKAKEALEDSYKRYSKNHEELTKERIWIIYRELLLADNEMTEVEFEGKIYQDYASVNEIYILESKLLYFAELTEYDVKVFEEKLTHIEEKEYLSEKQRLKMLLLNSSLDMKRVMAKKNLEKMNAPTLTRHLTSVTNNIIEFTYEGNDFLLREDAQRLYDLDTGAAEPDIRYKLVGVFVKNSILKIPGYYKDKKIKYLYFYDDIDNITELHIPMEIGEIQIEASITKALKKVVCDPRNERYKTDPEGKSLYDKSIEHNMGTVSLVSLLVQEKEKVARILPNTNRIENGAFNGALCEDIVYDDFSGSDYSQYKVEKQEEILQFDLEMFDEKSALHQKSEFVLGGVRYHVRGDRAVLRDGEVAIIASCHIKELVVESCKAAAKLFRYDNGNRTAGKNTKLVIANEKAFINDISSGDFEKLIEKFQITNVEIKGTHEFFKVEDGKLLSKDGKELYILPKASEIFPTDSDTDDYIIPDGVEAIRGNINEMREYGIVFPESFKTIISSGYWPQNMKTFVCKWNQVKEVLSKYEIIESRYINASNNISYVEIDDTIYFISSKESVEGLIHAAETGDFADYFKATEIIWCNKVDYKTNEVEYFLVKNLTIKINTQMVYFNGSEESKERMLYYGVMADLNIARKYIMLKKKYGFEHLKNCEENIVLLAMHLVEIYPHDKGFVNSAIDKLIEFMIEQEYFSKTELERIISNEKVAMNTKYGPLLLNELNKLKSKDESNENGSADGDDFGDI